MRFIALTAFASLAVAFSFACSSSDSGSTPAPVADAGTEASPDDPDNAPTQKLPNNGYFNIKGNVLGLAGKGLVIQNNGGDDLTPTADGPFTFPTQIVSGGTYYVAVKTQPTTPDQLCEVVSGIGSVGTADVTDVLVKCANAFLLKVTVSGLTGTGLVLVNNGADALDVTQNGVATFATRVVNGRAYAVTVAQQPTNQTCTVDQGTGNVNGADVTTPTVTCTP